LAAANRAIKPGRTGPGVDAHRDKPASGWAVLIAAAPSCACGDRWSMRALSFGVDR
jgi:hypothetical protein